MKPWSLALPAVLFLTLAACASAPAPVQPPVPPPLDPVGTFDFSTSFDGQLVNGTVVITNTDAGFGGSLSTTATETVRVSGVAVVGQMLTVNAATPEGPVVLTMEFKGDDFTGTWSYAGMSGTHTGKRRKL